MREQGGRGGWEGKSNGMRCTRCTPLGAKTRGILTRCVLPEHVRVGKQCNQVCCAAATLFCGWAWSEGQGAGASTNDKHTQILGVISDPRVSLEHRSGIGQAAEFMDKRSSQNSRTHGTLQHV